MVNEVAQLADEAVLSLKLLQSAKVDASSASHKSFIGEQAAQKMASQLNIYLEATKKKWSEAI
jgi:hypothetical protein